MEDVSHNGFMRHLSVVGVRVVDRVVSPFTYIGGKRFTVIVIAIGLLQLLFIPLSDKISNPWIGAGSAALSRYY
jgi:hypothetical protein